MNNLLAIIVFFPIIASFVCYFLGNYNKNKKINKNRNNNTFSIKLMTVFIAIETVLSIFLLVNNTELSLFIPGICSFGLTFRADGFRVLYTVISNFAFLISSIISLEYFEDSKNNERFSLFTLITLGSTLGTFLADDLITAFIFFEVMSLSSFVWVANYGSKKAMEAAKKYIVISILGGMVMLMGLFLLYNEFGTFNYNNIKELSAQYNDKTMLYIIASCISFGFAAKAGMFLLHIWLPDSYTYAPTPASTLLSSILTKSGIAGMMVITCNLLIRDEQWGMVLLIFGTLTMFIGALLAIFSIDMKRIIACSSMSQIGFIIVGMAMMSFHSENSYIADSGTILYMFNHTLLKLVLFSIAGAIYIKTKNLNLNNIKGYGRNHPILNISFLLAALGIAGVPLFNGYLSKTLIHESFLEYINILSISGQDITSYSFMEKIFIISGGMTLCYMAKIYIAVFIEKGTKKFDESSVKKSTMLVIFIPALLIPLLGIMPNITANYLFESSLSFVNTIPSNIKIDYFSLNNIVGSLQSIIIGIVLYFVLVRGLLTSKDENGERIYLDLWPNWLDINNLIYKPLILAPLTGLFTFVLRIFDSMFDVIIYICKKTVLTPIRPKKLITVGNRLTYEIGTFMDSISDLLNRTIRKKHPKKLHYTYTIAAGYEVADATSRRVTRSLSFGLFLFTIGLFVTLLVLIIE